MQAHDEQPRPVLCEAEIRRVEQRVANDVLVVLSSLGRCDVIRRGKLVVTCLARRISQTGDNRLEVILGALKKQSANVLNQERSWLDFGNRPNYLRKHVSLVVLTAEVTPLTEWLARGARRNEICAAVLAKIELANVSGLDSLPFTQAEVRSVAVQSLATSLAALDHVPAAEACPSQAECEPSSACE